MSVNTVNFSELTGTVPFANLDNADTVVESF